MTAFAINSFSRSSTRNPLLSAGVRVPKFKNRWLHQSLVREAIMMPAISPFMTEGTITRWKKKEGEAFSAGDVLLQIESDIAMIDVEAESAGILGKILLPDGTNNVPVEQVIALVARNDIELANLSAQTHASPPYNPIPLPPSRTLASPLPAEAFNRPLSSPVHRSPTLFTDHRHHRGIAMRRIRSPNLTIVPPSPMAVTTPTPAISSVTVPTPNSSMPPTPKTTKLVNEQGNQVDGAGIRRLIVSNLTRTPLSAMAFNCLPGTSKCDYFDGIL